MMKSGPVVKVSKRNFSTNTSKPRFQLPRVISDPALGTKQEKAQRALRTALDRFTEFKTFDPVNAFNQSLVSGGPQVAAFQKEVTLSAKAPLVLKVIKTHDKQKVHQNIPKIGQTKYLKRDGTSEVNRVLNNVEAWISKQLESVGKEGSLKETTYQEVAQVSGELTTIEFRRKGTPEEAAFVPEKLFPFESAIKSPILGKLSKGGAAYVKMVNKGIELGAFAVRWRDVSQQVDEVVKHMPIQSYFNVLNDVNPQVLSKVNGKQWDALVQLWANAKNSRTTFFDRQYLEFVAEFDLIPRLVLHSLPEFKSLSEPVLKLFAQAAQEKQRNSQALKKSVVGAFLINNLEQEIVLKEFSQKFAKTYGLSESAVSELTKQIRLKGPGKIDAELVLETQSTSAIDTFLQNVQKSFE